MGGQRGTNRLSVLWEDAHATTRHVAWGTSTIVRGSVKLALAHASQVVSSVAAAIRLASEAVLIVAIASTATSRSQRVRIRIKAISTIAIHGGTGIGWHVLLHEALVAGL